MPRSSNEEMRRKREGKRPTTTRLLSSDRGIMAVAPMWRSHATKTRKLPQVPQNRPTIPVFQPLAAGAEPQHQLLRLDRGGG